MLLQSSRLEGRQQHGNGDARERDVRHDVLGSDVRVRAELAALRADEAHACVRDGHDLERLGHRHLGNGIHPHRAKVAGNAHEEMAKPILWLLRTGVCRCRVAGIELYTNGERCQRRLAWIYMRKEIDTKEKKDSDESSQVLAVEEIGHEQELSSEHAVSDESHVDRGLHRDHRLGRRL